MAIETFDVVYEHLGDRMYYAGETREAEAADVEHLIPGTLRRRDKTTSLPERIDADSGMSADTNNAANTAAESKIAANDTAAKADNVALNKAEGKSPKTKGAD